MSTEKGQAHCWINQNAKLSLGYRQGEGPAEYPNLPSLVHAVLKTSDIAKGRI